MITHFLKFSLVSALATASVTAHFPAHKETDADNKKVSLDSQRSNCRRSFVNLVIVRFFIGGGHGDVVE